MNYAADFAYEDLDNLPVNLLLEPHTDEILHKSVAGNLFRLPTRFK